MKNKQINHDKHPDESKARTHRLSKLPDDGDPWASNNFAFEGALLTRFAIHRAFVHKISAFDIYRQNKQSIYIFSSPEPKAHR